MGTAHSRFGINPEYTVAAKTGAANYFTTKSLMKIQPRK